MLAAIEILKLLTEQKFRDEFFGAASDVDAPPPPSSSSRGSNRDSQPKRTSLVQNRKRLKGRGTIRFKGDEVVLEKQNSRDTATTDGGDIELSDSGVGGKGFKFQMKAKYV